jgi:hypothetical protein
MSLSSWIFVDLHVPPPITSYLSVLLVVLAAVAVEWALMRRLARSAAGGRLERFGLSAGEVR